MLSKTSLLTVALAIAACGMFAAPASAGSVAYVTTGVFNAGSTGGTGGAVLNVGGSTLSFTGGAFVVNGTNGAFLAAQFGAFQLTSVTPPDSLTGATFTLTIAESFPTVGTGTSTATITGDITVDNNGAVFVDFPGTAPGTPDVQIPVTTGVKYFLDTVTLNQVSGNPVNQTFTGSVVLPAGTPTLTPLPAAVWAGGALFGLVGLGKVRRPKLLA